MADKKISALTPASAPLAGTEMAPIVQGGATVKATAEQIATTAQPSGTANGVMYLNGSKVPTTSSTFNFNGSQLGFGVAASSPYGFRQIYTGSGAASQYGMYLDSYGDSSATGNIISIRAKARTSAAAFTCSTVADFVADTITAGAGSTITNAAGIILADQTAGGTNYGLGSYVSSGSNKWNLYISGTAPNYFNGGINVGSTTDPGAGNLSLTGNLIIGTSGKGIDFSADTHATGMTSELLDDYEEGTWTPVLGGDGGESGQSYTTQQGFYRKVGNIVFFTFNVQLSAAGSPGLEAVLKGLPFTVAGGRGYGAAYISDFDNLGVNVVDLSLRTNENSTQCYFRHLTAAAASMTYPISWQIYTNTTRINGGGFYIAA